MKLISTRLADCSFYYINLKERNDRKKNLENQFKNQGITDYTRIEAFYGKNFSPKEKKFWLSRKNFFRLSNNENLTLARVGCMLSHLKALETAIDNYSNKPVIIIEDDITFLSKKNWEFQYPENCDIFYLGGLFYYIDDNDYFIPNNFKDTIIKIDNRQLKLTGAFAILIPNLERLQFIYNTISEKYKRNIDMMYINYIQKLGNCYYLNPPIITHGDFGSNLGNINENPNKLFFGHIFNNNGSYWNDINYAKNLKSKFKLIQTDSLLDYFLEIPLETLKLIPNIEVKKSFSKVLNKFGSPAKKLTSFHIEVLGIYYFNGLSNYYYRFYRNKYNKLSLNNREYIDFYNNFIVDFKKQYKSIRNPHFRKGLMTALKYFLN